MNTLSAWSMLSLLMFPLLVDADTDAFLAQLDRVDDLIAAEDPSQAQQAQDLLKAALEEHRGMDYVKAEEGRLIELAALCAFGVQYQRPNDIQDALGCAKKPKWNKRSGSFEVTFNRDCPRNLQASTHVRASTDDFPFFPQGFTLFDDGILYSDVRFVGKCQIGIEGRLPAFGPGREHPPQVVLRVDDDLSYSVDYTWPTVYAPTVPGWTQGSIQKWYRGESTLLATDRNVGKRFKMMYDKKYDIKLVAKSDALAATAKGKNMLNTERRKGGYGRFGFRWCPRVSEVTLKGIVDESGIEEIFARHRERRATVYMASADPAELLPSWLLTATPDNRSEPADEG